MDPNQWAAFQQTCQNLYVADNEVRKESEAKLAVFQTSPDSMTTLRFALENTESPQVLMFVSSSILRLISNHWGFYTTAQLAEIRVFLLRYIINRGVSMAGYIQNNLLQAICRITKFGWFDERSFQNIFSDIKDFMAASMGHHIMALNAYHILLGELSSNSSHRTLTQSRRVAISFRDSHLHDVLQIALATLRQVVNRQVTGEMTILDRAIEASLNVVISSLSFDFVGTSSEEHGDDISGTIQIPSSWRATFEDDNLIPLFVEFYSSCQPPRSAQVLQALTLVSSVRRSLFLDEEERNAHLLRIVRAMTQILTTRRGLDDPDNFHEFCRFLARVKSNFQLSEVVSLEGFQEWLHHVFQFTISSLQYEEAPNSKYYLLGLWSRLVSALIYLSNETQSGIDEYAPQIIQLYIKSKFAYVESEYATNPSDELLDDEEILSEQLIAIPNLGRCKYAQTTAFIKGLIEPLLVQYQEYHQMPPKSQLSPQMQAQANVLEGKLIWLVFIIGCMVGGRESTSINDEDDVLDGILIAPVLQLRQLYDFRLNMHGCRNSNRLLELAVLNFIKQFRKSYLKDMLTSELLIFSRLKDSIGYGDQLEFLDLIVDKIAINLRHWYLDPEIMEQTLSLFEDLTQSYGTSKQLLSMPKIEFMFFNHRVQFADMLNAPQNEKYRSFFYSILGRLFFSSSFFNRFDEFMAPLQLICDEILSIPTAQEFQNSAVLRAVVGISRDLRALVSSCNTRRAYLAIYDWISPKYIPLFIRSIEAYGANHVAMVPILKFLAEFVANRGQRITFESSSADGILLFRLMSSILVSSGNCLATKTSFEDIYREKYKSVIAWFYALSRALSGGYANFGIFALYGDRALDNALETFGGLIMSIPIKDILGYTKLTRAYLTVLETLAIHHPVSFFNIPPAIFSHILVSLHDAIKTAEFTLCSQSCTCIDQLLSYPILHPKNIDINQKFQSLVAANAQRLNDILGLLLGMSLYEDGVNQWTISRPLLTLITISEQSFETWKQVYASRQPLDRQQKLHEALSKIMNDVQKNLESANRDQFTQNIIALRQEVKPWIA